MDKNVHGATHTVSSHIDFLIEASLYARQADGGPPPPPLPLGHAAPDLRVLVMDTPTPQYTSTTFSFAAPNSIRGMHTVDPSHSALPPYPPPLPPPPSSNVSHLPSQFSSNAFRFAAPYSSCGTHTVDPSQPARPVPLQPPPPPLPPPPYPPPPLPLLHSNVSHLHPQSPSNAFGFAAPYSSRGTHTVGPFRFARPAPSLPPPPYPPMPLPLPHSNVSHLHPQSSPNASSFAAPYSSRGTHTVDPFHSARPALLPSQPPPHPPPPPHSNVSHLHPQYTSSNFRFAAPYTHTADPSSLSGECPLHPPQPALASGEHVSAGSSQRVNVLDHSQANPAGAACAPACATNPRDDSLHQSGHFQPISALKDAARVVKRAGAMMILF